MRIRFLSSRRGTGYCYPVGSEQDVPDELAAEFIKQGAAQPVGKPKEKPKQQEPPPKPVDGRPIEALDLDDSTKAALEGAGLKIVGDIYAHEDLTKIPGIGKATARRILKAVME